MYTIFEALLDADSYTIWQDFERWAEIKERSPLTVRTYGQTLTGLHQHSGRTPVLEITGRQVAAFLDWRRQQGKAASTRLADWRNLAAWYSWAVREKWLAVSPVAQADMPEVKPKLRTVMTTAQIDSFADYWKGSDFLSLRNRAIFDLLGTFGTPRNAELCNLDMDHVVMNLSVVRILNGKGGIDRDIAFGAKTGRDFARYIVARRRVAAPREDAFFLNCRGDRLGPQGLRQLCIHTADMTGLPIRVFPHLWRHATWDLWLRLGGSRQDGEKLWGWREGSSMPGHYAAASAPSRAVDASRALLAKAGR